jgi:hypothetical protein
VGVRAPPSNGVLVTDQARARDVAVTDPPGRRFRARLPGLFQNSIEEFSPDPRAADQLDAPGDFCSSTGRSLRPANLELNRHTMHCAARPQESLRRRPSLLGGNNYMDRDGVVARYWQLSGAPLSFRPPRAWLLTTAPSVHAVRCPAAPAGIVAASLGSSRGRTPVSAISFASRPSEPAVGNRAVPAVMGVHQRWLHGPRSPQRGGSWAVAGRGRPVVPLLVSPSPSSPRPLSGLPRAQPLEHLTQLANLLAVAGPVPGPLRRERGLRVRASVTNV